MAYVDLFPDSGFFRQTTKDQTINLSPYINDIEVINIDKGEPGSALLTEVNGLERGSRVSIDDKIGILLTISDDWVEIEFEDRVSRIWNPTQVISSPTSNVYMLKSDHNTDKMLITGRIDYSWTPIYHLKLSENPNQIDSFSLFGRIGKESHSDHILVDGITFNTQPAINKNRGQEMVAQSVQRDIGQEEYQMNLPLRYDIQYKGYLDSLTSVPLQHFGQINTPKLYFIHLSPHQESQAYYGYRFELESAVPTGIVKIFDPSYRHLAQTHINTLGSKVFIKISSEPQLIVTSVVESMTQKQVMESVESVDQETQPMNQVATQETMITSVEANVKIMNNLDHSVQGYISLNFYGKLITSQPEPTEIYSNQLAWLPKLTPGENKFSIHLQVAN